MKRKIFIKDREFIYDFSRKKIKNINMRIHNDGSIFVSAPLNTSFQTVENFMISRGDWIIKHTDRLKNALNRTVFELANEACISILGEKYILSLRKDQIKTCYIQNNELIVYIPDLTDTQEIQKLISSFLENILNETLNMMCVEIYERSFRSFNISYPDIKIRKMKSRWGSCHFKNGKIIFNKHLVFLPKKCIEYVIYHEFTHFIHPNHSIEFYRMLKDFLPDFNDRKNELKKYNNVVNFTF